MPTKTTPADVAGFKPTLCFGTFFLLLCQSRKNLGIGKRNQYDENLREVSEAEVFNALMRIVYGDDNYSVSSHGEGVYKSCRRYKKIPCQQQASVLKSFNAKYELHEQYKMLLDNFSRKLIALLDITKDEELVKSLILLIASAVCDDDQTTQIDSKKEFQITAMQKAKKWKIVNEVTEISLPHFLLDVYHYILNTVQDNRIGQATYEEWCPRAEGAPNNAPRPLVNGLNISTIKRSIIVTREGTSEVIGDFSNSKSASVKSSLDVVKVAVDDFQQLITKAKTTANKESYTVISVRLRNDGEKAIYLNRLCIDVEDYTVDKTPCLEFSLDVVNGQLVISVLNKGWGNASDAKFNVHLFYSGISGELGADEFLLANAASLISSDECIEIFALSADSFCNESGMVAESAENISVHMQYEFTYDGRITAKTSSIVLPSSNECTRTLHIRDSLFAIQEIPRNINKLMVKPDIVYASVINGIDQKNYDIERDILENELDAFNLYIGSDKSSTIRFKLAFLHDDKVIATSDSIVAHINSYTNSKSYNYRLDGCTIAVEKFKNTKEFESFDNEEDDL